ncbi:glutathione ABC transporter substrate-binding protein [Nocardioides humi]|uniref:Glutathione ABC transporter substrate-binding protein n=2 Tax=Nocardioides humi TaxID=449461 RepID=A0ABN2ACI3_9ACTN
MGVVAAVAATAFLAACGSGGNDGSDGGDKPKTGGTLTYLATNLGPSVDPVGAIQLNAANQSGYIFQAIYDVLLNPTNDGIQPGLALSAESGDAINWTLKLRPDIEFSDGTPFNAEAVKKTWERNDKPGTTGYTVMQNVASLTATDDLTLEIALKSPVAEFPRLIANNLNAVGSPTAFEQDPDGLPVGAGPFKIDKWVPDGELSLVRNDNYWDAPKPYLDRLVFKPVADSSQALTALATNDAQAMFALDFATLDKAKQANYTIETWQPTIGSCLLFNTSAAPLDDIRVREALVLALNAQGESDTIEQGLAVVPTTLFTEDSPYYNPDIALPEYDKERAQELIDEVVAETGEPVKVTLAATPGPTQAIAEYFQSQVMTDIEDLEIEITVPDRSTYIADIMAGKFQAFMYSVNSPDPDAYTAFSTKAGNMTRYDDPAFQQALDVARSSADLDERKAAYDTISQTLADAFLGNFYGRKAYSTVYDSTKVGGLKVVGQGAPDFSGAYLK